MSEIMGYDKLKCQMMLLNGESTKSVQDFLINKYNISRSKTSRLITSMRKKLGIYRGNNW